MFQADIQLPILSFAVFQVFRRSTRGACDDQLVSKWWLNVHNLLVPPFVDCFPYQRMNWKQSVSQPEECGRIIENEEREDIVEADQEEKTKSSKELVFFPSSRFKEVFAVLTRNRLFTELVWFGVFWIGLVSYRILSLIFKVQMYAVCQRVHFGLSVYLAGISSTSIAIHCFEITFSCNN